MQGEAERALHCRATPDRVERRLACSEFTASTDPNATLWKRPDPG